MARQRKVDAKAAVHDLSRPRRIDRNSLGSGPSGGPLRAGPAAGGAADARRRTAGPRRRDPDRGEGCPGNERTADSGGGQTRENPPARQPIAETPPPPVAEPTPSPTPPPEPQAEAPPPEPDAEPPQPNQAETSQPKEAETPQPKEAQTPQPKQAETPPEAAKAQTNSTAPGAANVKGDEEKQQAQTIKLSEEEFDRLRKYVKGLTKRVQSHLRYPDEGRRVGLQGAATVSFTILPDGQIWPNP